MLFPKLLSVVMACVLDRSGCFHPREAERRGQRQETFLMTVTVLLQHVWVSQFPEGRSMFDCCASSLETRGQSQNKFERSPLDNLPFLK